MKNNIESSRFSFCPTTESKDNLIKENINSKKILVTGNTVIDALKISIDKVLKNPSQKIVNLSDKIGNEKFLLVTAHRENHGIGIKICEAILEIIRQNDSIKIVSLFT